MFNCWETQRKLVKILQMFKCVINIQFDKNTYSHYLIIWKFQLLINPYIKDMMQWLLLESNSFPFAMNFHQPHSSIETKYHFLYKTIASSLFLTELFFPHCVFLASLSKNELTMNVCIHFWDIFCSIGLCVCFYVSTLLFWLP
jgi:hypothetical protein